MISVLGLSLESAIDTLKRRGYLVQTMESRSKKGIVDGKPYVVRQLEKGSNTVILTFSMFKTEPNSLEA